MRSILITVLLIIVVVIIYNSTVGGDDGMKQKVVDHGGRINETIESINP